MLDFQVEELSGNWVAHSEVTRFKSYWIHEGAWTYLSTVQGDRAGATISKDITFDSLAQAMQAANKMDAAMEAVNEIS